MSAAAPGLACIGGRHLMVDVRAHDEQGASIVGGWCLWCGTAAFDSDRVDDDGRPVGFVPSYEVRVPDGFHRTKEDIT